MMDIPVALILTLVLELFVAYLWKLRGKDLLLCMMVNLLTNPLVSLVRLFYPPIWVLVAIECAVVGGEGLLYRKLGRQIKNPYGLSLAANLLSATVGSAIMFFFQLFFWR